MSKKIYFLISFVLVLALAGSASAQTYPAAYWSGFGDDPCNWDDPNNWWTVDANWDEDGFPTVPSRIWAKAPNAVPDVNTIVLVGQGTPWYEYPAELESNTIGYPVIDGQTAVCYQIYISTGPNDSNGPGRLDMSAGTLTSIVISDDWLGMQIGNVPGGSGVVNLSGGDIVLTNSDGEGGLLTVGGNNYYDTAAGGGIGTLNMTGGTLSCYHMDCPDSDAIDPNTTIGYINLHGGTFYTTADEDWTEFWMGDAGMFPDSRIDITDGIARITSHNEDEVWWINLWIDEGKITAFSGAAPRAELYVEYDDVAGETTLQAIATELCQAYRPQPRPGKTVDYRATLKWAPGDGATSHIVYFDTDKAAVVNGTAPNTPTGANSLYPGIPDFSTRYYWRVDEVNDPCVCPGVVWSYKTADYIAVDDFDSYVNQNALWAVWDDYWVNWSDSQIFIETGADFVRAGKSIKYKFTNTTYTSSAGKFYFTGSWIDAQDISELGIGGDSPNWSAAGSQALTLYFLGDPCATVVDMRGAKLWVELEDTSANVAYVLHPDANDTLEGTWHEWNIKLQDFADAGVVLSVIDRITIGIGGYDRTGQGSSKTNTAVGEIYLEDIRLYPPRCIPEFGPAADVTFDCIVDNDDLAVLAGDWLKSGYDISAVPPLTDPNRLVRYTFDTEGGSGTTVYNTDTTLGSAADGTFFDTYAHGPGGPLTWETPGAPHPDVCDPNYCIQLQGHDEQAVIMDSNLNDVVGGGFTTNTLTISAWVKRAGDQAEWTGLVFCTSPDEPAEDPMPRAGLSLGANDDWTAGGTVPAQNHLAYHWENCPDGNDATPDGEDQIWWWRSGLLVPDGVWTFCAVAVEPEQATMYMMPAGGDLYSAVNIETHVPTTFDVPFNIGRDARILWGPRTLNGQIDDVQIYDYALSDIEIISVAGESGGHVGLVSLVDYDVSDDIDFFDYGFMADGWLTEELWPPE